MAQQGAELASQRRPGLGEPVGLTGLTVAALGAGAVWLGWQLPPTVGTGLRQLLLVLGLLASIVGLAVVATVVGGVVRARRGCARLRVRGLDVSGVVTQITPTVSGRWVSVEYRFQDQRGRTYVSQAAALPVEVVRGGRLVVGDEVRVRFHERDPRLSDLVLPGPSAGAGPTRDRWP